MLKFVPPKDESKKFPRYASYAAGELKVHPGVGFAKNSLQNRMWTTVDTDEALGVYYDESIRYKKKRVTTHAFILENVEGEYFVLHEIKPGLTELELPWYKDYIRTSYGVSEYTEYYRTNKYYQEKIENGSYSLFRKARPMTTDEYVAWRIQVERERLGVV